MESNFTIASSFMCCDMSKSASAYTVKVFAVVSEAKLSVMKSYKSIASLGINFYVDELSTSS